MLASTLFAGINIGADTAAKQALEQQLSNVLVDMVFRYGYSWVGIPEGQPYLSSSNITEAMETVLSLDGVNQAEVISRSHREWLQFPDSDELVPCMITGISENSRIYDGLNVTEGRSSLQASETYIWVGSSNAGDLKVC